MEISDIEVPVTAMVTAYQRVEQTLVTLAKIKACCPAPAEILVHVDSGQENCAVAIQKSFPEIKVIRSNEHLGPGGSRNKLMAAASYDIVASFDDDSYPLDPNYFDRLIKLFDFFSDAAIICARLYHQGEIVEGATHLAQWTADFAGGASAYRRNVFLATAGYVPLPVAYGMEEVDFALRLHAQGGKVLHTNWIRVFHDTNLDRHTNPNVTTVSIANIALLVFLRYPIWLWLVGSLQVLSRILWLIRHKRFQGIGKGLWIIPVHLWKHREFREPVLTNALLSYLALRRNPIPTLFYPDSERRHSV